MLKQQAKIFTNLTMMLDVIVLLVSFVAAYYFRTLFPGPVFPLQEYLWALLVIIPVWVYLLGKFGLYSSVRRLSLFDIVAKLVNVHLLGGLIVSSAIYFIDRDTFSRGILVGFFTFSLILLSGEKFFQRLALGYLRSRGLNTRHLLIVGTKEKAQRFHDLVMAHQDWGLKIDGFVQVAGGPLLEEVHGHRVLGRIEDLVTICKEYPADEVVFCLSKDFIVDAEAYLKDLEELGVTVRIVLDFYDVSFFRRELSFFHDELPILTYHPKAFEAQQLLLKRLIDLVGALVGLSVTLVLLPFIALAIKLDSSGPVFFAQKRVGENGRIFRCWKFRSMAADAEHRKGELIENNEMKGALFKMKNDPRVTRVGQVLRRTSLDEFPQFWNVLVGQMSLVGTRPPTPEELTLYKNWHRRRISIKPGITGLWQVSGRSAVNDFDEIVRLDLFYIDNWNLWLDLKLLLKTVGVVLSRRGSY